MQRNRGKGRLCSECYHLKTDLKKKLIVRVAIKRKETGNKFGQWPMRFIGYVNIGLIPDPQRSISVMKGLILLI